MAYLYWWPQEECRIQVFNANQNQHRELIPGRCLRVTDWSADGRHLLLENSLAWLPDSLPTIRIRQYSFAEDSLHPFVVRDGDVWDGSFSPSGEWVAFSSDEHGTPGVFVRSFSVPSRRVSPSDQVTPGRAEEKILPGAYRNTSRERRWLCPHR